MSNYRAAWHPLPNDPRTLRFWDGRQWTGYYRHWDGRQWAPGVRPQVPVAQQPAPMQQPVPPVPQVPVAQQPAPMQQPVPPVPQPPVAQQPAPMQQPVPTPLPASSQYGDPFTIVPGRSPRSPQAPYASRRPMPFAQPPTHKSPARWLIPVSVASVFVLVVTGIYLGVGLDRPVVSADGVQAAIEAGQIETVVNSDITDVLSSEIVYTDSSRELDYTRPIVDIDSRQGWVEFGMEEEVLAGYSELPQWVREDDGYVGADSASWAVRIFADADLTVEIGTSVNMTDNDTLQIRPLEPAFGATMTSEGLAQLSSDIPLRSDASEGAGPPLSEPADGQWGLRDTYYVVRYASNDGKYTKLERPVVSTLSFTQELETPVVSVGVDADATGYVELTWDPVPGATFYRIFSSMMGEITRDEGRTLVKIAQTSATRWTAADSVDPRVSRQNFGLQMGAPDQDADSVLNEYSLGTEYGVIAYDESGRRVSALGSVSAHASSLATLPYEVDFDRDAEIMAGLDCNKGGGGDCSFADRPVTMPYVALNGDQREGIAVAQGITKSNHYDGYDASMVIEGTSLEFAAGLGTNDEGRALALVEEYNERATGQRPPAGELTIAPAGGVVTRVESVLGVPDDILAEVHAENELVAFIGAHMYAGHETIDMSDYAPFWDGGDIQHAAQVAIAQNPDFGAWETSYVGGSYTLYVDYRDRDVAQEALVKVRSILDDLGVDSMTDAQKVAAINKYIIDHVEYDYTAADSVDADNGIEGFEYAWTLEGAVLRGQTVCAGYSMMFLTMADEAGLDAVYVTGYITSDNVRHAWNKVNINGEWLAVDTTWNDVYPRTNPYLLITDDEFDDAATRSEDNEWLMGSTGRYATP